MDFDLHNHGSICVLVPLSNEAVDWADENLPEDAMRWCGGIVIEPRYVGDIVDGLTADGLTVNW